MAKRITSSRVKKWAIGSGIIGVPLGVLLIWYLVFLGAIEVTGYSGDMICEGTELDPCLAFINFSVKEDVFVYPSENWSATPFYMDTQPKSMEMYRSWGKSWREIDLTKSCNGAWCGCGWCTKSNTAKFSYAFREGRDYQIKYEVIKANSEDIIKWGFGPVDPLFFGYNSSSQEVFLSNATIKLDTPIIYNVLRGKDRLVAEFTIESLDGHNDVFSDMNFYDVKANMMKFDRDFVYKIKSFYDVKVFDYEMICNERLTVNGSIEKYDCFRNQTGSHIEERFDWDAFNEKVLLPKGNITLGIFTDVYSEETIEWVPTFFGIEINEWATWSESFSEGLEAYYNFSDATETVSGIYNLSVSDGGPTFTETDALIGKAGNVTVNNNWNITSSASFHKLEEANKSLNFWFRPADISGTTDYLMSKEGDVRDIAINRLNNRIGFEKLANGTDIFKENVLPPDIWTMLTIVTNDSDIWFYVNGSHVTSWDIGLDQSYYSRDGYGGGSYDIVLGAHHSRDYEVVGLFDEMGWWNRTLSDSEISDLYNEGTGLTHTPPPTFNFTCDGVECTTLNIEMGTQINISANASGGSTVCIDIDHPSYNDSYICGTTASLLFNISYFRKNELNDSSTQKDLTYAGAGNETVYIASHQYDEMVNFSINVSGHLNEASTYQETADEISSGAIGSYGVIYENYTTPIGATNQSKLQLKMGPNTYNFTMNNSCWNTNKLQFKITSGASGSDGNNTIYCKDGGGWVFLNSTLSPYGSCTVSLGDYVGLVYDGYWNTGTYYISGSGWLLNTSSCPELLTFEDAMSWQTFTYPTDVKIYINNTLSNDLGLVYSGDILLTNLLDGSTIKNISFDSSGTETEYLKIPKNAVVSSAYLDLSGHNLKQLPYIYFDGVKMGISPTDNGAQPNWGCYGIDIGAGAQSLTNGTANTIAIVAGCSGGAAKVCSDLNFEGYNNWYLPATHQLNETYDQSVINNISKGDYGSQWTNHSSSGYWSSTENSGTPTLYAWYLFWPSGTISSTVEKYNLYVARCVHEDVPSSTELSLEVGIADGLHEWNYTGFFNVTNNKTDNFNDSINTFLDLCNADSNGYCNIPLYFISDSSTGDIKISDIEVNFTNDPNPINISIDLISSFLGNSTGFANIPIKLESTEAGIINITDIRFDYAGGNDTIEFLVYEEGDKSNNKTLSIINFFSGFTKLLPYTWVDKIFFIPRTNSSKNVDAYGQTVTIPLYNITTINYGGKNMNLVTRINESFDCVDFFISQNSTKPISSIWDGLVGYWPLDIDARDVGGEGHNGAAIGAIFNESGGQMGGTYEFDGVDDYIEAGNVNTSSFPDIVNSNNANLSISMWYYPEAFTSDLQRLFEISTTGGNDGYIMQLRVSSSGKISAPTYNGSSNPNLETTSAVNLGEWVHIVAQIYPENENLTQELYINSILNNSASINLSGLLANFSVDVTDFFIGGLSVVSRSINGTVDEVRLYNHSLSASEVSELYDRSKNRYYDQKLITNWTAISWDLEYLNNTKLWAWADFENCDVVSQKILQPYLHVESYCDECEWEE